MRQNNRDDDGGRGVGCFRYSNPRDPLVYLQLPRSWQTPLNEVNYTNVGVGSTSSMIYVTCVIWFS